MIGDTSIEVRIYWEYRRNVRFSIGKTGANLRLPIGLTESEYKLQHDKFERWLETQFGKSEQLQKEFEQREYKNGDVLTVGERVYYLHIEQTQQASHKANIKDNHIYLRLTGLDSPEHTSKAIQHLISRTVAQDFLPAFTKRVYELASKFFKEVKIGKISLKYNQSNWGSCSSHANLNFSTRLLFAPQAVIDYVIIHELAHLKEMNHSARFWKIVGDIMPDYTEKEDWLKENSHLCRF